MNYHALAETDATQSDRDRTDPVAKLCDALLSHPRFEAAALYYFDNVMEWRREIGYFNNFISSYSRNTIIAYVCFLHFANETGLPEGGATFSRIWKVVERRGDCGSRALRTILGLISFAGYFSKQQGAVDKRSFAYVPTQKLLTHYGHHLANTIHCFDILLDVDIYGKRAAADPGYVATMMRSSGAAAVKYDITFAEFDKHLLHIANMCGGFATLYSAARAEMRAEPMPQLTEIARRYKVSPSQARAVITYATRQGLMSFDEAGNLLSADKGTRLIKMLLARELALYAKFTLGLEEKLQEHLKA